MTQTCTHCSNSFDISDEDLSYYQKVSPIYNGQIYQIPPPKLCPDCRRQRRFTYRNESSLYYRTCDFTKVKILAMYPADAPFPVYSPEVWFGDKWDARTYGRDFDFNRPFFEQFKELRDSVPHLSLVSSGNENCDFCNIVGWSKNCYLCYGSIECENCYYGSPFKCKDSADSLILRNSELCLECVDSNHLYQCYGCQNCSNSRDLFLCYEVKNSENCFGCVGLNRKQFHIFNQAFSKEEYEKYLASLDLKNPEVFKSISAKFKELKQSLPHRAYAGTNNENVSGNSIFDSKNSFEVYGGEQCQNVKFGYQLLNVKDSMDVSNGENGELDFEVMALSNNVINSRFSYFCWDGTFDLLYSAHCLQNVQHCFGSIGLKHASYCILNKQYTKEEYETLMPRIIDHMRKTGEWGEFFPMSFSPFAYNETIAVDHYPLSREAAIKDGLTWHDEAPSQLTSTDPNVKTCEVTGKLFKLIPQELKFYERFKLPLPQRSPKQRHIDRIALGTPMKLWTRECSACSSPIQTGYSPDRPEKVLCEKCYLATVY